jgi:hypothetical protein
LICWELLIETRAIHRPEGLQHYCTIQALPLILGSSRESDAAYLDTYRVKRNTVEYDRIGSTSDSEALELIEFVRELRVEVIMWLQANYPELLLK